MATCTDTRLQAATSSPREARQIVRGSEELLPFPDLRFAAQLLTSELVANAVRHAGLPDDDVLFLSIDCSDESLRVEVGDRGSGFDPLARLAEHRRNGEPHRGLFLVDALADRWGFRREPTGYRVWFELDLMPGRRPWRGRESTFLNGRSVAPVTNPNTRDTPRGVP